MGTRIGSLRVIKTGLKEGDRIAVNGPARVGPGMPIEPREVDVDISVLDKKIPLTRIDNSVKSSAVALVE